MGGGCGKPAGAGARMGKGGAPPLPNGTAATSLSDKLAGRTHAGVARPVLGGGAGGDERVGFCSHSVRFSG